MADESLSAFISVETDADAAAAQIKELPGVVGQTVTQVNEQLARLAQENPFARVITDSERAALTIEQITQAAEAAAAALSLIADANARLESSGTAARVTGAGGLSTADIEAQNAALQVQLDLLRQEAALRAEMAANPTRFGNGLPFTGGTQPGTAFLSDAEIAEAQRQEAIASARNLLVTESRSTKPLIEPGADIGALTAVPIDIREDFGALATAMSEGAAAFEGKSIIAVREAWAGVNGTIEPGFYNSRTGQPLSAVDQLYYGGKSTFMGGSGGGGFFGNLGKSFGGGGDDGFNFGDLGAQAGVIARYVLIYQIFRDIERSIKESVDQALSFDRAVTDLSNRLEISKNQAAGLATNIGLVGAQAGLGPADTINYAATYAGAFQGQASQTDLLGVGAQTAAQVQVLTGKVKDDLPDTIAAIQAFNLNFSDTQRVLDAATSAAQNYGLANAHDVLPGLAQIGDLAAQSGFSVEQTANALADIVTRTHDTSQAVAGQLQRFLGREGQPAFQQVFAQQGISTSLPFSQELEQLSERFDKLSDSQKSFISSEFGGGRAGVAALAFIEDYQRILSNTQKSLDDGGVAQKNYEARLHDIVGAINAVRGELKELAKDVGTSGIGAGFAIAVETAKPLLQVLDEIVRLVSYLDSFGGHFTIGRDLVIGAAEIAAAVSLLGRLNIGTRIGAIFGRGGGGTETTPTSVAADATTEALNRLAAAADRSAASMDADAEATAADAEAKTTDAAATTADAEAKVADAEATTANAAAQGFGARAAGLFGISGLLGASAGGIGRALISPLGIIGGLVVAQQSYEAASGIKSASNAAYATSSDAYGVGSDPTQLQDTAQRLRQSAAAATASSGGVFGSYANFLNSNLFGRGSTTDVATQLRAQASLLQTEAQRANAARVASTEGGDFADLINLSKQGGVADGLKTLAALGLDSAQQLDALTQKLQAFADASTGAANYLAKGASALAAQNFANATTNNLTQIAHYDEINGQANPAEKFITNPYFLKNVAPGLNKSVDDVAQRYLQGLEGGDITPENYRQLGDQAYKAMVAYLEKVGLSPKDIASIANELRGAAYAAAQTTIAQVNAAAGQAISPDAVGAVVAGLPQLLSGAQSEATVRAQLGGNYGPFTGLAPGESVPSTSEAGLRAALTKAQNTYKSLASTKGTTKESLQAVQDQIDALQVQVQEAVIANIDAEGALALASIAPENQTAQIEAHIGLVQSELAVTKNPDDRLKLRTSLEQYQQQLAASKAQDRIATIGVGSNPADSVGQASIAAQQADATVRDYIARGVTGAALSNAEKAASQAHYSLVQAEAQNANAYRDSQVAIGDKVGEAYAAYQDALETASTLAGGARANALRDAAEKYQEYLASIAQHANAITAANARSGDPLSQARAQLTEAKRSLDADIPGTDQYYADLKAWHDAAAGLAQAVAQHRQTTYLLNNDTTDPVAQATASLVQARTKLRQDQRRGTGDLDQDNLNVETAFWGRQKAVFDQKQQNQQNAYDLQEESAAQYLRFLEHQDAVIRRQLAGMKKGSEGYQQLVDELTGVDKNIKSISDSMEGQFNLGDIITPTVYEARREANAEKAGVAYNDNKTVSIVINGASPKATAQFAAMLDEHLGTAVGTAATAVAPGGRKY